MTLSCPIGSDYNKVLGNGGWKISDGALCYGMTDPEFVSTHTYTTEVSMAQLPQPEQPWFHYRNLSSELKNAFDADRAPPQRVSNYMLTLGNALFRLPDQAGTFWRGVRLSKSEQATYTPGSVHTLAAFSSFSRWEDAAFSGNTRFRIKGKRGKDISGYSAIQSRKEVLFMPGTKVRVVGKPQIMPSGIMEIEVEEVDYD